MTRRVITLTIADFNGKKAPFSDRDRPEPKVSFVQKVGEDVCGVGAYKG